MEDVETAELVGIFLKTSGPTIMQGLQEVDSLDELQSPLRDLMEEVKIDFV
jgi:hypothetical protein